VDSEEFCNFCFYFHTAVERLSLTSIQASQSSLLKFVKKWLNLPCNCTPAAVFHPDVLDLPFLPHFKESAKLYFILAIERSTDPLIIELRQSFFTTDHLGVSDVVFDALSTAKASIYNIKSTFKNASRSNLRTCRVNFWESRLETLTVQNKFLDIVSLEQKCPLWQRLMCGLPGKQLSFLLHAACDTLPTSMNKPCLVEHNCKPLCSSSQPTS